MKSKYRHFAFLIFVFICNSALSQTADEFSTKAAFIVKMTHFINWPENLNLINDTSDFTICLQGPKKYFSSLEKWAQDGSIKKRSVTLQYINGDFSQLSNCHILYISDNNYLNAYLEAAQKEQFLTISNTPGNSQRGVIVNFFSADKKLRFEINFDVANELGFKINPRLLKLAKIITSKGIIK